MNNHILGNLRREDLLELLMEMLGEKRYNHVLAVEEKAVELCKLYNQNENKCRTAALYHDFAKSMSIKESISILDKYEYPYDELESQNTDLLHAKVAGILAEKVYGVGDRDTIEAILYHTTGKADMTLLSKIIFVADAIEKNRDYPNVNLYRELAIQNLDMTMLSILNGQIIYLVKAGKKIHPDTLQARNYLLD